MKKETTDAFVRNVDARLYKKLTKYAKDEGVNISFILNRLIEGFLDGRFVIEFERKKTNEIS